MEFSSPSSLGWWWKSDKREEIEQQTSPVYNFQFYSSSCKHSIVWPLGTSESRSVNKRLRSRPSPSAHPLPLSIPRFLLQASTRRVPIVPDSPSQTKADKPPSAGTMMRKGSRGQLLTVWTLWFSNNEEDNRPCNKRVGSVANGNPAWKQMCTRGMSRSAGWEGGASDVLVRGREWRRLAEWSSRKVLRVL